MNLQWATSGGQWSGVVIYALPLDNGKLLPVRLSRLPRCPCLRALLLAADGEHGRSHVTLVELAPGSVNIISQFEHKYVKV